MGGKKALGVAVALSALVLLPPHRVSLLTGAFFLGGEKGVLL